MSWQPGNWITFEDWAGIIRTGQIRNARRDLLIVTHYLHDGNGYRWRIHEAIGEDQIRHNSQAA